MCRKILDMSLQDRISKAADLVLSKLRTGGSVILFSVSAITLLLNSCSSPGQVQQNTSQDQSPMGLYRQASDMLKNRDPRGETVMRQALAASEKQGNPHTSIGIASALAQWLFDKERYKEAKKLYLLICDLGAKTKSSQWQAEGRFKAARCDVKDDTVTQEDIELLEEGLKLQPEGREAATAKRTLAHVYSTLGQFDKAEAAIKDAIGNQTPVSNDLLEQSYLELCRGKYNESFAFLKKAHQMPSRDGKTHSYWNLYNSWLQFHDPISKEWRKNMAVARELFNAMDYDKLESLADTLRKDQWVNAKGYRRIYGFYEGIRSAISEESMAGYVHHAELVEKWSKAKPKSTAALIALADAQKSIAWKARGTAYAQYVTEEGWKGLATHLADADTILERAKKTGPIDEHWYGTKLTVLLGQSSSDEDYEKAYNEGIKAFPTAEEIYYDKAYWLQPRWHGEQGEFEEWLKNEADRISGDDGDRFYARIIYQLDDGEMYKNLFQEFPSLSWERAKHGFQLLMKDFPEALAIRGKMLKLAENAGDSSVTSQAVFGKQ